MPEWTLAEWLVDPGAEFRAEKSRPMVVLFWNYGEPASLEALELLQTNAVALGHRGLRVVTIHTEVGLEEHQSREGIVRFLEENGILLPTARDRGTATLLACHFEDVPALLFVDARGSVRGQIRNYRSSKNEQIEAFIRGALLGIESDRAPTDGSGGERGSE